MHGAAEFTASVLENAARFAEAVAHRAQSRLRLITVSHFAVAIEAGLRVVCALGFIVFGLRRVQCRLECGQRRLERGNIFAFGFLLVDSRFGFVGEIVGDVESILLAFERAALLAAKVFEARAVGEGAGGGRAFVGAGRWRREKQPTEGKHTGGGECDDACEKFGDEFTVHGCLHWLMLSS